MKNLDTGKTALVRPGAFVFCERESGTMRFQVEASPAGQLPVEQAASMLAMHCLVHGLTPCDYTVLVSPQKALLHTVERRADELLKAGCAIRCDRGLTSREREVLDGVLSNLCNKEIASQLNISERTVKFHVSALLAKFKVSNRFGLIHKAMVGLKTSEGPGGEVLTMQSQSPKPPETRERLSANGNGHREVRILRRASN